MKKITNIVIISILILTGLLLSVLYFMSDSGLPRGVNEDLIHFNDGWKYSADGGDFVSVDSLSEVSGVKADVVVIKNTIPNVDESNNALQFNLSRALLKVYHEDELVYIIDESNLSPVGKSPGNLNVIIELPNMSVGDEIAIELCPVYGVLELETIYLGSESANIYTIIQREFGNLLLSALMAILGLVEILIFCFVGRKNKKIYILHIGFFTLLAGLYTFTVLPILMLFLSEPYVVSVASYLLLSLLPIPFLFFLITAYNLRLVKHLYVLLFMHVLYWLIVIILQANNLVDVREPILIFHILLAISIATTLITALYEIFVRKNKQLKVFGYSGVALCFFAGIDLYTYYFANENYMSTFFKVGVISFSVILLLGFMRDITELLKENTRVKMYEKLAFEDILTSLMNRAAFERDFATYKANPKETEGLCIGMFDVNGLKEINDTLGHKQGDELIKSAAHALKTTFDGKAKVYRVGGDEFSLLSKNISQDETESLLIFLQNNINKNNENSEFVLSIAGALCLFDADKDSSIDELWKRVDQDMYKRKMEMKNTDYSLDAD